VWQALHEAGKDHGFTVLAVALDEPAAARPWIEQAAPAYPCLIDREHRTAELYHMVNVPTAVWIDEQGRMVRPPENAGSTDAFRRMDRTTLAVPDDAMAERARVKTAYFDAARDWALRGSASPYALDGQGVRSRLAVPDGSIAQAHAHFRLAQMLVQAGRVDEADAHFAEASRLHPDSWAIWRQAAPKGANGIAGGPEFMKRVDALGERPYYPPVELASPRTR
jgi:hypothetical protein